MKTIARLLGGGVDSENKMMDIYNFEDSITQVSSNEIVMNMHNIHIQSQ